jgi:hypothetical protein
MAIREVWEQIDPPNQLFQEIIPARGKVLTSSLDRTGDDRL